MQIRRRCEVPLLVAGLTVLSAVPAAAHHVMDNQLPQTFVQGLLSGFGHPVIGVDHLAAVVAVGCIAAVQSRGAMLAMSFVWAMILGAALHTTEATLPGAELAVASSVMALGFVMLRASPVSRMAALALFTLSGFFHGYALGESIVGAEPAPLYAYFLGLAIAQSAVALGAMMCVRSLLGGRAFRAANLRLVGAGIVGIGAAVLAQQLGA